MVMASRLRRIWFLPWVLRGMRVLALLLALRGDVLAQEILLREGQTEPDEGTFTIPFVFFSDSLGAAAGASVGNRGFFQPQASTFATVVGSVSGTAYGFLAVRDLEVPQTERLYINGQLNVGSFREVDLYTDGNPEFPDERAGSNDSDADNFLTGDGTDVKIWTLFGYVLPLGSGEGDPKSRLVLRDGVVIEGARDTHLWNPLHNGYTLVGIKPFYRQQNLSTDEAGDRDVTTAGAEFLARYENTDFHENPSRGSAQQIRYSQDWGTLGSTAPWQTVDVQVNKYVPLAEGARSRQRVLALTAWWIDTPSWNNYDVENGVDVYHRPPAFAGASLGGLERMRGYSEGRFNDRSAAYYAAEYRHMPQWNPLREVGWLNRRNARVQWLQYVVGMEVGRVADDFDLSELHADMKVSGLLGLRAMVNTLVVRADVGITAEGGAVQMTIDQPF
ncbi:MAG: BamA/TamA family outer membrane protein [Verrucomicrobia bacterium]|nr:BamA/TamA family outer membrane protein [Verrucomicrobiota bacterium]